MKENKYDDEKFFEKYSQMARSVEGLEGAGEWHELKNLLPDFQNKRVLDLGCGFGWHCEYAAQNGAKSVIGIDISTKMLEQAQKKNKFDKIQYICQPIEEINFEKNSFDVVISSLAFHYIESFEAICKKVNDSLCPNGMFIFSVEHPVFTAYGTQDWFYDEQGKKVHWPVDNYFREGKREAIFLGEKVVKYHKTLTTYINSLLKEGFEIIHLIEPKPEETMMEKNVEMLEELRRPMMLLLSARKKA